MYEGLELGFEDADEMEGAVGVAREVVELRDST